MRLVLVWLFFAAAFAQAGLGTAKELFAQGEFSKAAQMAIGFNTSEGYALAARAINVKAQILKSEQQLLHYQLAQNYAQKALDLNAKNPDAHLEFARAIGEIGVIEGLAAALAKGVGNRVRDALNTALAIDPDHAEALLALGMWHVSVAAQGSLAALIYGASAADGERLIQKAIAQEPKRIGFRLTYAKALVLQNNRAKALGQLEYALQINPKDAEEKINLTFCQTLQKELR
jgi:tetratricopeptide (TPR) repeat protein